MRHRQNEAAMSGQGQAAKAKHSTICPNSSEPTPQAQATRLPAYAGALLALRRTGRTVPHLVIAVGWHFGKALPRIVVPDDMAVSEIDLGCVRGLDCMVVHHGESVRAFDVAERALLAGANRCPVFNMATCGLEATTSDVLLARRAAA